MCGDIHGALSGLVYDLVERYKIEHADILVLGDFGAGFGGPNAMNVRYDEVKKRLEGNDLNKFLFITFLSISLALIIHCRQPSLPYLLVQLSVHIPV